MNEIPDLYLSVVVAALCGAVNLHELKVELTRRPPSTRAELSSLLKEHIKVEETLGKQSRTFEPDLRRGKERLEVEELRSWKGPAIPGRFNKYRLPTLVNMVWANKTDRKGKSPREESPAQQGDLNFTAIIRSRDTRLSVVESSKKKWNK